MTNKPALLKQFKVDQKDGTTLCLKFQEWYNEQTDKRLIDIQSMDVTDITDVADLLTDIEMVTKEAKEVIVLGMSKMKMARIIYEEESAKGVVQRKTCLTRFMEEAGCTAAGANTYYNTIRNDKGLVNHKG